MGAYEEANFVQNLIRLREQRGWTQSDLARWMAKIGWSAFRQTTVSRIEKGERPIRLGEAHGITGLLETTMEQMVAPPIQAQLVRDLTSAQRDLAIAKYALEETARKYEAAAKQVEIVGGVAKASVEYLDGSGSDSWGDPLRAMLASIPPESAGRVVAEATDEGGGDRGVDPEAP